MLCVVLSLRNKEGQHFPLINHKNMNQQGYILLCSQQYFLRILFLLVTVL